MSSRLFQSGRQNDARSFKHQVVNDFSSDAQSAGMSSYHARKVVIDDISDLQSEQNFINLIEEGESNGNSVQSLDQESSKVTPINLSKIQAYKKSQTSHRKYLADSHRALFQRNDEASSSEPGSMNKRLKEKYKVTSNSKVLFTFGKSNSSRSSINMRVQGISRSKVNDQSGDTSLQSDNSDGTKLQRRNIVNLTSEDSESRGYDMSQDASAIQLSLSDHRMTTEVEKKDSTKPLLFDRSYSIPTKG